MRAFLGKKRTPRPLSALPADGDDDFTPSDKQQIRRELDDIRQRLALLEAEVGIYSAREQHDNPYHQPL